MYGPTGGIKWEQVYRGLEAADCGRLEFKFTIVVAQTTTVAHVQVRGKKKVASLPEVGLRLNEQNRTER